MDGKTSRKIRNEIVNIVEGILVSCRGWRLVEKEELILNGEVTLGRLFGWFFGPWPSSYP